MTDESCVIGPNWWMVITSDACPSWYHAFRPREGQTLMTHATSRRDFNRPIGLLWNPELGGRMYRLFQIFLLTTTTPTISRPTPGDVGLRITFAIR